MNKLIILFLIAGFASADDDNLTAFIRDLRNSKECSSVYVCAASNKLNDYVSQQMTGGWTNIEKISLLRTLDQWITPLNATPTQTRNSVKVMTTAFSKVMPVVSQLTPDDREFVFQAYRRWLTSPTSLCTTESPCVAAKMLRDSIDPKMNCVQLQAAQNIYFPSEEAKMKQNFFTNSHSLGNNFRDGLRYLKDQTKRTCAAEGQPITDDSLKSPGSGSIAVPEKAP